MLTKAPVTEDLAEARAMLEGVLRLMEGLEDAPPELRKAAARLERIASEVARIERTVGEAT